MPMECPWCGLESSDERTCEWCGRIIAPSAPHAAPVQPSGTQTTDDDEPFLAIDPFGLRLQFFLGMALPVAAVGMAIAHLRGFPLGLLMAAVSLVVCFFLSVYQIVERVDNQWAPVGLACCCSLVCGPIVPAVGFSLLLGRAGSGTVAGLLWAHLGAVLLVSYAAVPEAGVALRAAGWMPGTQLANFTLIAGIAGWALGNFGRPLNE